MISSGKSIGASGSNAPMSEINTTPLVDVMLVLLVIFIITAPLMTHAVRIDLPKASSQLLNEKPEVISISIDHGGKVYWNDVAINAADVKTKLDAAAKQNPQPEVHIRADKDTRYQVLAEIMANAQTAGITKLGFVSEPK
ncbi:MAG: biopolymer transporter ExbD [Methylotenera sp.]